MQIQIAKWRPNQRFRLGVLSIIFGRDCYIDNRTSAFYYCLACAPCEVPGYVANLSGFCRGLIDFQPGICWGCRGWSFRVECVCFEQWDRYIGWKQWLTLCLRLSGPEAAGSRNRPWWTWSAPGSVTEWWRLYSLVSAGRRSRSTLFDFQGRRPQTPQVPK